MSQEQLEARRELERQQYQNQSLEILEARRSQSRIRAAQRLLSETEEQATLRRERAQQRITQILQNETEEEAAARTANL